ncbi:hypothetical protein [Streptomyces sp. NPDC051546]|uniref:hypothetical protein n=1 Tax=Streptomyces sp. NPDC051546 TaxID=3365655 RepID=UPI00378E0B33
MNDETWTSDEFGASHQGRVGVLLADGSTPKPVYFDGASSTGHYVAHWSVYDGGTWPERPRAAVLRAECVCGWAGAAHTVDWTGFGDLPFREAGTEDADRCMDDWDGHIADVARRTIPLPPELETLLESVSAAIENLAGDAPVAAVKAARQLEIIAQRTGHWPANQARAQEPEQVAAALGLNVDQTRSLLARFGRWSPYS